MKIKSVCQQTGLTDRAIRYYIEEELIAPDFKENYFGRRTFAFTQADVDKLCEISVLRKFGFSVAEIHEMYAQPNIIGNVLRSVMDRKEQALAEEHQLLQVLTQAQVESFGDVSSLASYLAKPVEPIPVPPSDKSRVPFSHRLRSLGLFLATWLPLILCAIVLLLELRRYQYPMFNVRAILLAALSLLPSLMMLLLPHLRLKKKPKQALKMLTLVLCGFSIMFGSFCSLFIIDGSETTNIKYYRKFDASCSINRSDVFQALFPKWPYTYDAADARYYYRNLRVIDWTYDVYAEWTLKAGDLSREIARVTELMGSFGNDSQPVTVQRGGYTCWILYHGDAPFTPATENYDYAIFAYNEAARRVRYVICSSGENGADQPYYLELDWD